MARYLRREEWVDAFRWTGEAESEPVPDWATEAFAAGLLWFDQLGTNAEVLVIETPAGTLRAWPGDYVVCSPSRGIFPLPRLAFLKSYADRDLIVWRRMRGALHHGQSGPDGSPPVQFPNPV